MKRILTAFFISYVSLSMAKDEFKIVSQIPDDVKSVTIMTPIFSQKLGFSLPTSWDNAMQERKGIMFMMEFKPKSENIDAWRNLLTVQGFENFSKKVTAEQFLKDTGNRFKAVCKSNLVFTDLGASNVDGFKAYQGILGCSKVPGQNFSEVAYWLVIEGENDLYVIQKAVRSTTNDILNAKDIEQFTEDIKPIRLCKKTGEIPECLK